jgi:hypothetical protein
VGPGRIYSSQAVDATPYGSLLADTADLILKQGIQLGSAVIATPAPGTAGFSINYLIEAVYQDVDAAPTVLAYYNAANPAQALIGPNGSNTAQNTLRTGTVSLQAKAGVPAATGTQNTPPPDAGFVGLYVVTVANGQATVTAPNISVLSGAPFMGLSLGGRTVNGKQGANGFVVTSGNNATTGLGDLVVLRAGSTANQVAQGPNLTLWDTSANTESSIQNSGGQTEFWQFNAGVWRQWAKVSANLGVTINAPNSGPTLVLNGTGGTTETLSIIGANNTGPLATFDSGGPTGSYIRYRTNTVDVGHIGAGSRLFSNSATSDFAIRVIGTNNLLLGASASLTAIATLTGGGGMMIGAPAGGDQGAGTINANAFFVSGVNLVTTVQNFATSAANTAQANAIAAADAFATNAASTAANTAQTNAQNFAQTAANNAQAVAISVATANAVAISEAYANGTALPAGHQDPGGFITQGGVATGTASAPGALITFPTPFTNSCISVVACAFGANATATVLSFDKNGFHLINGVGGQCTWIAIGT